MNQIKPESSTRVITNEVRQTLQQRLQGEVIIPGDGTYDASWQGFNLSVVQHPAVIVIARGTKDVVEAVRFANEQGLGIAVQSTGHGITLPANNALLIITSQMTDVRVDADKQTAWIEAGAKWGQVLGKTQEVGLAPLLGSSPTVGVIGYLLGGGIGWLARKYGLAADTVHSFNVVIADGNEVRASATENSDLFWALRGGGGSFGVITSVEIQLFPITTVFGGDMIYPGARAKELLTRYRDWIASNPPELTTSVALMNFPPFPELPPFLRGQSVVMIRGCFAGPAEEGQALIKPWLDWAAPIVNTFAEMPFTKVGTISNDPQEPGYGVSAGGDWLSELSDEAIDTLVKYGIAHNGPCPLIMTEVRHVGGAFQHGDKEAAAFSNRDGSLLMAMVGAAPTPEAYDNTLQYARQFKADLKPYLTGKVYINLLEGQEARNRTGDGYLPETYQRLQVVKAKYDPKNLFCFGYDIPPLADGAVK